MNIIIQIETHAYAEEKLCDEILDENLPDDVQSCGILGPEIILPLRRNRHCELKFEYTEATTVGEVQHAVLEHIQSLNHGVWLAFLSGGERFKIGDRNACFSKLVEKYLDPCDTGKIKVAALVSLDAGVVCEEGQLRYVMHSGEAGKHHLPHVHVHTTSHEFEASISIQDGQVLAGNLPPKLLKKARKKISEDRDFFLNCWCTLTDGLIPDINYHYGYIKY